MTNILVADDEVEIIELIELYLNRENINIYKAFDGLEALNIIQKNIIHLAIIDIMMPNLNGFQLIEKIRKTTNIPIIILSARVDFTDKIIGLDIGADDYITKPFNSMELVARVKAQLRRFHELNNTKSISNKLHVAELLLNIDECTLKVRGILVPLTSKEFKIMETFMRNVGMVYTKKQILSIIWDDDSNYYHDNTVRVHISNLREKIEDDPKNLRYIINIRGLGYKLVNPEKNGG